MKPFSFNDQCADSIFSSYLIVPYGNTDAKPMSPSVKTWIKWMRIIQLVFRCLEILCSVGLLVMMILIRGVDSATGWIMRIVPGVAILHTVYGIYHLGRKPSGRTPASSASYMLFSAFFDVSIVPFYAFSALVAKTREASWKTVLPNQALMPIFSTVVFYLAAVGGGLYLGSLIVSIYLAVTFRKITKLPPDMNPLEDNLTSRHKRNKSSMSVATTISEKRISAPLESKRSSGAAYEDLSRPPTIPFFHTRTGSTESFSTYKSTPPPTRDSRLDLPSRQYQIGNSPRASVVDLKRASYYDGTSTPPPKRASYTEIPLSDTASQRSSRQIGKMPEAWYTADSLPNQRSRTASPKKGYQPLYQLQDSSEDISFGHPNPLNANPPTPRHSYHPSRDSPLSEISNNQRTSGDIADVSSQMRDTSPVRQEFKAKHYGELKPGTPPIMIGGNSRQVSSGNDFPSKGTFRTRDVSGKIAEEGRGGNANGNGWGTRFRKISGL